MMNKKLIKEIIRERNSKALFLDEKFDDAIIGTGIHSGKKHVAAYNSDKCIEILLEESEMDIIEAYEQFQITSELSSCSENKPIFISDFTKAKEPPIKQVKPGKTIKDTFL